MGRSSFSTCLRHEPFAGPGGEGQGKQFIFVWCICCYCHPLQIARHSSTFEKKTHATILLSSLLLHKTIEPRPEILL